jgi:hypothetical protein
LRIGAAFQDEPKSQVMGVRGLASEEGDEKVLFSVFCRL